MGFDYIGHIFAASVASGGILAYMTAGSVYSLSYGLILGSLLAAGAYMNGLTPPQPFGQLFISVLLILIMGWRFYKTCNLMPGLIVIFSKLIIIRAFFIYRDFIPLIGAPGVEI
ncbi:unnamed protein product [Diamesa serratosioi]